MKKIILASKSPRRKELLSKLITDFECIEADIDELSQEESDTPWLLAMQNAKSKAEYVFLKHPDCTVIGADTIVACGRRILGKPKDKDDAKRMLGLLSGTVHEVYTGIYIKSGEKDYKTFEKTSVTFGKLDEAEIEDYILTGEPMDKAGAYGIQGKGALFVSGISGDFYNVVGLPLFKLKNALKYM